MYVKWINIRTGKYLGVIDLKGKKIPATKTNKFYNQFLDWYYKQEIFPFDLKDGRPLTNKSLVEIIRAVQDLNFSHREYLFELACEYVAIIGDDYLNNLILQAKLSCLSPVERSELISNFIALIIKKKPDLATSIGISITV